MPRVFIPQLPMRRNNVGTLIPMMDLTPAEKYGELVTLLPHGRAALDPETSLPLLREKLKNFRPDDFILPIGAPVLTAWTAVIAAAAHSEPIKMLVWDDKYHRYDVVIANPI